MPGAPSPPPVRWTEAAGLRKTCSSSFANDLAGVTIASSVGWQMALNDLLRVRFDQQRIRLPQELWPNLWRDARSKSPGFHRLRPGTLASPKSSLPIMSRLENKSFEI